MSVSLLNGNQAAKIAESFTSEETQRKIWYAYISNVTAYNVNYRENTPIDFKGWEENEAKFEDMNKAIDELAHLLYNAYTNAGNSFAPAGVLDELYDMVKAHRETQEYKDYEYELRKETYYYPNY